jgi:hypothetical protein
MSKLKVMTVVGTRPEIIRLSRVMIALDRYMNQVIVHTGQNYDYELNQIFFDELELRKPDYFLEAAGKTACETVGNVIARIDPVMERELPMRFSSWGTPTVVWPPTLPSVEKFPYFTWKPATGVLISGSPKRSTAKSSTISAISICLTAPLHGNTCCGKVSRRTGLSKPAAPSWKCCRRTWK